MRVAIAVVEPDRRFHSICHASGAPGGAIHFLPKSPIRQAISYAVSNWTAPTGYIDDGDLHIDNDPAENAIRPIVLGRQNWLFAGGDNGRRTAAILSSFTASSRRHEIDPFTYLCDILTRIAACPINEIDQFLLHSWHAACTPKKRNS